MNFFMSATYRRRYFAKVLDALDGQSLSGLGEMPPDCAVPAELPEAWIKRLDHQGPGEPDVVEGPEEFLPGNMAGSGNSAVWLYPFVVIKFE